MDKRPKAIEVIHSYPLSPNGSLKKHDDNDDDDDDDDGHLATRETTLKRCISGK